MGQYREFQRIINNGMRYEFNDTELTVTDYWSGKCITIDLGALSEEAFDEIVVFREED